MKNKYFDNISLRILFLSFISFENKYQKKEYLTLKYEIKVDLLAQKKFQGETADKWLSLTNGMMGENGSPNIGFDKLDLKKRKIESPDTYF